MGMDPSRTLYLTILEGPSPAEAVPIVSTHDARVIHAVAQALGELLGEDSVPPRVLTLQRDREDR